MQGKTDENGDLHSLSHELLWNLYLRGGVFSTVGETFHIEMRARARV